MSIPSEQIPFVVVQCPSNGDAEFASRWLAAAAEADRILAHHRKASPDFERAIERLGVVYVVEFSPAAMAFVSLWINNGPAYYLNIFDSEWSEAFAYMAGIGFFTRTDQHYQMTHPHALSSRTIARALLQLAETEDEEFYLHPEWLLTTMTQEEAHRDALVSNFFTTQNSFREVLH